MPLAAPIGVQPWALRLGDCRPNAALANRCAPRGGFACVAANCVSGTRILQAVAEAHQHFAWDSSAITDRSSVEKDLRYTWEEPGSLPALAEPNIWKVRECAATLRPCAGTGGRGGKEGRDERERETDSLSTLLRMSNVFEAPGSNEENPFRPVCLKCWHAERLQKTPYRRWKNDNKLQTEPSRLIIALAQSYGSTWLLVEAGVAAREATDGACGEMLREQGAVRERCPKDVGELGRSFTCQSSCRRVPHLRQNAESAVLTLEHLGHLYGISDGEQRKPVLKRRCVQVSSPDRAAYGQNNQ